MEEKNVLTYIPVEWGVSRFGLLRSFFLSGMPWGRSFPCRAEFFYIPVEYKGQFKGVIPLVQSFWRYFWWLYSDIILI
jgi:hypothetical protein